MIERANLRILEVEARMAAVVRKFVAFAAMPQAQREARLALDTLSGDEVAFGPRLTIWRPPEGGLVDYAPGVLLSGPMEVSGAVTLFALPAGRAAHLRLRGSYEGLPAAWQSVFDACAAAGLTTAGLNWEIYAAEDAPPGEPGADLYALLA